MYLISYDFTDNKGTSVRLFMRAGDYYNSEGKETTDRKGKQIWAYIKEYPKCLLVRHCGVPVFTMRDGNAYVTSKINWVVTLCRVTGYDEKGEEMEKVAAEYFIEKLNFGTDDKHVKIERINLEECKCLGSGTFYSNKYLDKNNVHPYTVLPLSAKMRGITPGNCRVIHDDMACIRVKAVDSLGTSIIQYVPLALLSSDIETTPMQLVGQEALQQIIGNKSVRFEQCADFGTSKVLMPLKIKAEFEYGRLTVGGYIEPDNKFFSAKTDKHGNIIDGDLDTIELLAQGASEREPEMHHKWVTGSMSVREEYWATSGLISLSTVTARMEAEDVSPLGDLSVDFNNCEWFFED